MQVCVSRGWESVAAKPLKAAGTKTMTAVKNLSGITMKHLAEPGTGASLAVTFQVTGGSETFALCFQRHTLLSRFSEQ